MHRTILCFFLIVVTTCTICGAPAYAAKEFLTEAEITSIRKAQVIDERVHAYMRAAALRLQTAKERLVGKESKEGDPLEFFTPEEMLDGYNRILQSVMTNLDEAFRSGRNQQITLDALTILQLSAKSALEQLKTIKKLAEKKEKEKLWDLVNEAIELTDGAYKGAEEGLTRLSAPPGKKQPQE